MVSLREIDSKRIKLNKVSSLPLLKQVTKVSVLVSAVGANGRTRSKVDGRDGRDIHASIKELHTCLESSC